MDGDAGHLARGVETGHDRVVVGEDLGLDVGGHAAHGVVGRGEDRHELGDGIDAEVGAGKLRDVGQLGLDLLLGQVREVEVDVVLVGAGAAALADLGHHGARHHVARGKVLDRGGHALHEAFAVGIAQNAALAASALGEEHTQSGQARRVELVELHVLQREAASVRDGHAITREGVGIGGRLPDLAVAAGGEDDRLRGEDMDGAGGQLVGHDPGRFLATVALHQDEVEDVELVVELHALLDAVLVERLEDHVTGAVGGVAGAAYGGLAVVACVPAEASLVDPALGGAIEGQAHLLEVDDGVDGLAAHDLRSVLVDEVVTALDGVEGVPLPVVLLHVGEGGAHATLRRAGVAARRVELGEDGRVGALGGLQSGAHAGAAGTHDHDVEPVGLHGAPSRWSGQR